MPVDPSRLLSVQRPELAREYSPKNTKPLDVLTIGSGIKALWNCPKGHEYASLVYQRVRFNTGCPACVGRNTEPLSVTHPALVAEWDPSNHLQPSDVTAGSKRIVTWRCSAGHTWKVCPNARTNQHVALKKGRRTSGCPTCARVHQDPISITHPELAAQLVDATVGETVYAGSGKKAFWQCAEGHTWEATVSSRIHMKAGCPRCAGRHADPITVTHPHLVPDWADESDPAEATAGMGRKVWWNCPTTHGRYSASVASRVAGGGCPWCAGRRPDTLDVSHPHLTAEWIDEKPIESFSAGSGYKALWRCEKGHEWRSQIGNRALGTGCPHCWGLFTEPLAVTHPSLVAEWDDERDATSVTAGSNHRAQWKCATGHTWRAVVVSRARLGAGCPECLGRNSEPVAVTHPELLAEWDDEDQDPQRLKAGSPAVIRWRCPVGHSWTGSLTSRTSRGATCSRCTPRHTSQREIAVMTALAAVLGVEYTGEPRRLPDWPHPVDFHLETSKLVVQYDGWYWHQHDYSLERDRRHTLALIQLGYQVLRVREQRNRTEHLPSVSEGEITCTPWEAADVVAEKIVAEIQRRAATRSG